MVGVHSRTSAADTMPVTSFQVDLEAQVTNDVPLIVSAGSLNEQDEELFEILLTDPQYSGKHLDKLRADALKAPPAISPELQRLLKEQVLFDPDDFFQLEKPQWLHSVCEFREHMAGAALYFWTDGVKSWYLFLYATQSPQLAVFSPLTLVSEYTVLPGSGPSSSSSGGLEVHQGLWNYVFNVDYRTIVTSFQFPAHPGSILLLHHGMVRLSGGLVVTNGPLVNFGDWTQ